MNPRPGPGRIITFYSYKGGTGRSMALANVAWILASNGKRVLALDWDLEAPGLHHYFRPYLIDPDLSTSNGVIDLIIDFATAAVTPPGETERPSDPWYLGHADILRYATSLDWEFPGAGTLDFVPAGRQTLAYATRVNSFNWEHFYDRLGGGAFLEAVKDRMRSEYDYVLIDSRTGVSDTSSICTVQMPDDLVICFTLNNQSIEGASAIAASVRQLRQSLKKEVGAEEGRLFPVPMRIEFFEKKNLERARAFARRRFDQCLWHIPKEEKELYWGHVEVTYWPFYAYEEILAVFGDNPNETNSLLASMERIADYLTDRTISKLAGVSEPERYRETERFLRHRTGILASEAPELSTPTRPESIKETHGNFLFISYSPVDGSEFAVRIADALATGSSPITTWLDRRDLRPGEDWDYPLSEAIRTCDKLLLVMTRDSVRPDSGCKDEWDRALKHKKPVILLRLHAEAELPFRLGSRPSVDFTGSFHVGLAQLRSQLAWMDTPEGVKQELESQLADVKRGLSRVAQPSERARIEREIEELRRQISEQQYLLENSQTTTKDTQEHLASSVGLEREPEYAAKTGRMPYAPGFGQSLEKWPTVLNSIANGRCTPILGPAVIDAYIGPRQEIARRWASTFHFPIEPPDRSDLPQVAQYLAVNQDTTFPYDEFQKHVGRELLVRYGGELPDGLYTTSRNTPERVSAEALDEIFTAVVQARRKEPEFCEPHSVLAELPLPLFVTTQPTDLMEEALRMAGKQPVRELCRWKEDDEDIPWPASVFERDPGYQPDEGRPLVFHLFGHLRCPGSMVLTEDDYFDFLIGTTANKNLVPPFVRKRLSSTALLFLGFQVDELDFQVVSRTLVRQEGRSHRARLTHVMQMLDPKEQGSLEPERARTYLDDYLRIENINIYWGSTENFIRELGERWRERQE